MYKKKNKGTEFNGPECLVLLLALHRSTARHGTARYDMAHTTRGELRNRINNSADNANDQDMPQPSETRTDRTGKDYAFSRFRLYCTSATGPLKPNRAVTTAPNRPGNSHGCCSISASKAFTVPLARAE